MQRCISVAVRVLRVREIKWANVNDCVWQSTANGFPSTAEMNGLRRGLKANLWKCHLVKLQIGKTALQLQHAKACLNAYTLLDLLGAEAQKTISQKDLQWHQGLTDHKVVAMWMNESQCQFLKHGAVFNPAFTAHLLLKGIQVHRLCVCAQAWAYLVLFCVGGSIYLREHGYERHWGLTDGWPEPSCSDLPLCRSERKRILRTKEAYWAVFSGR